MKRQLPEEMPEGKPKEAAREKVMSTLNQNKFGRKAQKMMSLVVDILKIWLDKWI